MQVVLGAVTGGASKIRVEASASAPSRKRRRTPRAVLMPGSSHMSAPMTVRLFFRA